MPELAQFTTLAPANCCSPACDLVCPIRVAGITCRGRPWLSGLGKADCFDGTIPLAPNLVGTADCAGAATLRRSTSRTVFPGTTCCSAATEEEPDHHPRHILLHLCAAAGHLGLPDATQRQPRQVRRCLQSSGALSPCTAPHYADGTKHVPGGRPAPGHQADGADLPENEMVCSCGFVRQVFLSLAQGMYEYATEMGLLQGGELPGTQAPHGAQTFAT